MIKFRFRYNGLLALCIVLSVFIVIQHRQIQKVEKILSDYAKTEDVRLRSQYVNHNITEIDIRSRDAMSMAKSAYDMAYKQMSRDEWMIGLTTEQVDSIRLSHNVEEN